MSRVALRAGALLAVASLCLPGLRRHASPQRVRAVRLAAGGGLVALVRGGQRCRSSTGTAGSRLAWARTPRGRAPGAGRRRPRGARASPRALGIATEDRDERRGRGSGRRRADPRHRRAAGCGARLMTVQPTAPPLVGGSGRAGYGSLTAEALWCVGGRRDPPPGGPAPGGAPALATSDDGRSSSGGGVVAGLLRWRAHVHAPRPPGRAGDADRGGGRWRLGGLGGRAGA